MYLIDAIINNYVNQCVFHTKLLMSQRDYRKLSRAIFSEEPYVEPKIFK